jgi:hypothetical protein
LVGGTVAVAGRAGAGFEIEYVGVDGTVRCGPLAQCWSVQFEEVAPARSFPSYRGQRNFPGWWWSSTMGRHVGYESWLDRDQVMLLDFDPQVTRFASQPFWLRWPAGDGVRRHLPDYFARRVDGTGVVVDVRADDRIERADAEAFAATAAACREVGWEFRRVGTLDGVFAANVRWLSRYRHPRCGWREDLAARLLEVFAEATPLFTGAERVGDRLAVLPVLYHLLWRQALGADLGSALLGPSSVVWRGRRRPV